MYGFNVAFVLWDGFTEAITRCEVKLAEARADIKRAVGAAKTDDHAAKFQRRAHKLGNGIRRIKILARSGKIQGLSVAGLNMIILAAFYVYPGLDSELSDLWLRGFVAFMIVVFSLVPAVLTWCLVEHEWNKLKDIAA